MAWPKPFIATRPCNCAFAIEVPELPFATAGVQIAGLPLMKAPTCPKLFNVFEVGG